MTFFATLRRANLLLCDGARRFGAALRFRTGRSRALEDEIARLRAENRALVNSILGIAGIPPLRVATTLRAEAAAGAAIRPPLRPFSQARRSSPANKNVEGDASARSQSSPSAAEYSAANTNLSPRRRRSWQQLGRALEIEDARAARRERETDTSAFPPPRNAVVREPS
jgi:hypothetical protein